MQQITKIVVEGNKIIVFKKKEIDLGLVFEEKDIEERFSWLPHPRFSLVLPTWAGYGYAWDRDEQAWYEIDISKQTWGVRVGRHLPENIFRAMAIPAEIWSKEAAEIPVEVKMEAL